MKTDPWSHGGPLTDALVAALTPPTEGNRLRWDTKVRGLGIRITTGSRAFIFNYRNAQRRERRITIGSPPEWNVAQARRKAAELRRQVDGGADPLAEREAARDILSLRTVAVRFEQEHVGKLRRETQRQYRGSLKLHVPASLMGRPITDITRGDLTKLHTQLAVSVPFAANRTISVLSSLFSFAIEHGLCTANPAAGVKLVRENRSERYLTGPELARLLGALDAHAGNYADLFRLLLLTGSRKGETMKAAWSQFDLDSATWTKPAATTKQGRPHRTVLSPEAVALLRDMRARATSPLLFPKTSTSALQRAWRRACEAAEISEIRVHDCRHSFASLLVSNGLSLPVVGALLGHTRMQTTQRYAHLADQSLRDATAIVGKVIGKAGGLAR
jgi:integrase